MLRLRRGIWRRAASTLAADAEAVGDALSRWRTPDEEGLDLEPLVVELFEEAPTSDIRSLRERGTDGHAFFEDALRPNWQGRSRGERTAKIEAFARLVNTVDGDDPAGVGAVVRTKVLVLGWAYDQLYGGALLEQLAHKPQRFGRLELPA
jgi:hypothetical protein